MPQPGTVESLEFGVVQHSRPPYVPPPHTHPTEWLSGLAKHPTRAIGVIYAPSALAGGKSRSGGMALRT
ncbi:hypothetical protein NSERKGN1266_26930 [Nocardia seriolae]|nr:hypothetical protein NSERKGN1266_26930 [Nocardia seriolae]